MARVITVNDVLDRHVVLDIECLDRVYLNAYVPILQSSGQVVAFMTQHLGMPIPSPALMEKISTKFRRAVESFASANGIAWVRFGKDDRKIDVMQPYLDRQAATGRSGVAAVGVAQEFQRVWSAYQRDTQTAAPQYTFAKADRRVTCYYFYLWDEDFGAAFIKVCAYFPYPAKIWVNGHEWAKRQARKGRDRVHRAVQRVRGLRRPGRAAGDLRPAAAGHHRGVRPAVAGPAADAVRPQGPARPGTGGRCSMRQVEVSRTIVFDAPRRARFFFEALISGQPRHRPPGQRGDHLRPPHPPRHPGHLPHRHRPARDRPGRRRRRAQRLLQALAGQAVPQRRPGDADRDRHQRAPQSAHVRANVCKVVPEVHRLARRMSWTWSAA